MTEKYEAVSRLFDESVTLTEELKRRYPLDKTDSDLARKTIEALQDRTDCCSLCLSSPFSKDWKEYVPLAQIDKGWWAFKCDNGHYWTCGMA